jgi:hypothetical protein
VAAETSPKLGAGPIFIVGSMGSGTTLMRLILDSHENIAIAQETGFMRAVLANKWIPFWKFGGEWYSRLGWKDEELDEALRAFYGEIFGRFARDQGKTRWGDKTPYHTWHMETIAQVFPDAVFVGMVRHPGAVTASVHSRFKYSFEQGINHWRRSNIELACQASALGNRVALCRYEDLVLDTEATLREVLTWLGEPWSDRVLEHHVVHQERGTSQKVEGRTRSDEPIDTARMSRWTSVLDGNAHRLLHEEGALAELFGYSTENPDVLAPMTTNSSERRRIITGSELAQRLDERPETIDFTDRSQPSAANQLLKPQLFQAQPVDSETKTNRQAARKARPARRAAPPPPPPAAPPLRRRLKRAARRLARAARRRLRTGVALLPGSSRLLRGSGGARAR